MLEKHIVFSVIRAYSNGPMPYQYSTPPGEKCGLTSSYALLWLLVLLNHDAIQRRQSAGSGKLRGNAAPVINSIPPRRSARAGRPQVGSCLAVVLRHRYPRH